MNFKGILFDLDGTLLDTSGMIVASFQHTFQVHYGKVLEPAQIHRFFGKTMLEAMSVLAADKDPDILIDTYRQHQMAHDDDMGIFPHVAETLTALAGRGIKMAVVTSRRRETAISGLEKFGIRRHFPVVIGAHQCEKHKPDPEPIYKALDALGLKSGECLMVGDSPADIAGGHNANMKAAAVKWTYMDWGCLEREKPEYVLETMADLKTIVFGKG